MFDPEPLLRNGYEARRDRRLEEARDLFAQAVAESRWTGNTHLLASCLKALGQVERDLSHPTTALQCYRQSAAIEQSSGDRLGWAHSVRHVADILREQKEFSEADTGYQEVLQTYRAHTDARPLDHANALRGMALLKEAMGDSEEALLMWRAASGLYGSAGIEAGTAESESHIAFLLNC